MSLDMFRAVIQGYSDRVFDLQILAVQQGYWAGYYSRAKKPKSLESILNKMHRANEKHRNKSQVAQDISEVDVATFIAREQKRLSKIQI